MGSNPIGSAIKINDLAGALAAQAGPRGCAYAAVAMASPVAASLKRLNSWVSC